MSGGDHTGRASIPAPQRYQRNPTVVRSMPETGNNRQATDIPQSGDLPLASGAGLRDAARPNPLQAETPNSPPALPQSSGRGVSLERIRKAKRLLAFGFSLAEVADISGLSRAELDLQLWQSLGARA